MTLLACKLPLAFDPAPLQADVGRLPQADWEAHFNTQYHDGGWRGASLRSVGGTTGHLFPGAAGSPLLASDAYADTVVLGSCPGLRSVLAAFECPLLSVRLLRLQAGRGIREHRDDDLRLDQGLARVHVPVFTNPGVEFYLDGRRVIMREGEAWYLNLELPHRVHNHGTADRVHLVIDCAVNDWLRSLLDADGVEAGLGQPGADWGPATAEQFEQFRGRVLRDPDLQARLWAADEPAAFAELMVQSGHEQGYRFLAEDVRSALAISRREWLESRMVR